MIRLIQLITTIVVLCCSFTFASDVRPDIKEERHFVGTDYEFTVYEIFGRRDGNTLLILGGIQGDEPGGYLSADLYSDIRLEQGNLIIIPRASMKSIVLFNRGIDGDMNRLFVDNLSTDSMDKQVVSVIMKQMAKADMFLNLHDGWGFHSDTYMDSQRNPNRFGQSVIVDTQTYTCDDGRNIPLEEMAKAALKRINSKIDDKSHHLSFFNTRTDDPNTKYKDMTKTATWYALRKHCIPAFGIESSKNISSVELKILYHNYAVNEFMRIMDVLPEIPPVISIKSEFKGATISINGTSNYVKKGETVNINKGDILSVDDMDVNFTNGVSCDILNYGNYNDFRKDISVDKSTKVLFKRDSNVVGEIFINVQPALAIDYKKSALKMELNNLPVTLLFGGILKVSKGDIVKVLNLEMNDTSLNLPVNLRGWVPKEKFVNNNGDDRGYTISANVDDFIQRFALGGGKSFPITVDKDGVEIFRAFLNFE